MLHVPQGFTGTTTHDLLVARRLMEKGNLSTECKNTFVSDVPIKQGSYGIAFLLLLPFSIISSDMLVQYGLLNQRSSYTNRRIRYTRSRPTE